jgi:hypothetical protein
MAGDRNEGQAFFQNDMPGAFASDLKAGLSQGPNGAKVRNARNLWQLLNGNFDFPDHRIGGQVGNGGQIFADSIFDVLKGLGLRAALRPAAG